MELPIHQLTVNDPNKADRVLVVVIRHNYS